MVALAPLLELLATWALSLAPPLLGECGAFEAERSTEMDGLLGSPVPDVDGFAGFAAAIVVYCWSVGIVFSWIRDGVGVGLGSMFT